jgi:hypothetical protein
MKKYFFGLGSFSIKDGLKIRSGKTNGLVTPPFGNSIRPYITLCVTKVVLSPK